MHAECWETERIPFPFDKELRVVEARRLQLERLLREVDELTAWLKGRRKLWPRGAEETVRVGGLWIHRMRSAVKKKPPAGKH